MKLSGLFWLSIVAVIHLAAYTLGIWWFVGCYILWTIVGIMIYSNLEYGFFSGGYYQEDMDFDEMWKGFLEAPYLYLLPHLLVIGFFVGFFRGTYLLIVNIADYFSNFNSKLDNIDLKPKPKPKKHSYGKFKDEFKSERL